MSRPASGASALTTARLRLLALCFVLAFVSIGIRLVDMVGGHPAEAALAPPGGDDAPDPRRADITDRNGALLATNIATLSVIGDPMRMNDPDAAAAALARVLDGVDAAELGARFARGGRFVWVKRQISPTEQAAVLDLGLPGVEFRLGERRIYPRGEEASHVLGFVDIDNQGLAGIEYGLQDELVGGSELGKAPVRLAIDLRIQRVAHAATSAGVRRFRADGACTIVLDMATREVVSLVSLPDFDPNRPEQASPDQRRNRCTSSVYELGSLFKVVSVGMALQSGAVSLHDRFDASEPLQIGRHRVRDFHGHSRWLTVPEILAFSSNIGTTRMTFAAGGSDAQRAFLKALGLLDRPVLEIPETTAPLVPDRWPDIVTATVSYGHGVAVSPMQFIEAVTTLAGDGRRVPATLLERPADAVPDGPRIVSAVTASDLRWLMWLTVDRGTATQAAVPGYLIGGKTGTADKPTAGRRGYDGQAVLSSLVAVFPIDAPRYAVLTVLDEPKGDAKTYGYRTGGWTAAPVVARIIAEAGPLLGVPRASPESELALHDRLQVVPVMNGRTRRMEDGFAAASLTR